MSYQETIAYLFGLQKHGIKLGLSNSYLLMGLMGDPHRRFRSIHIAGTNGKGSTAAFLASALTAAGYRTGLYTSPHLVDFSERIRIKGVPITEERVVELAGRVRQRAAGTAAPDGSAVTPTFFEVTTTMAFTYFAEEGVDIAVIEAGMGGRLDSTNVLTPLVSVITNIDLEHTEFLGTTLAQIAGEKAGIIKPGVPVVTGAVQAEAIEVIELAAKRNNAPLYRMPKDFSPERAVTGPVQQFDHRGIRTSVQGLSVGMLGRHQIGNACLAAAALECAADSGIVVPEPALRAGVAYAAWEGRLERAAIEPDIYLDGAHNPASALVLAEALTDLKRSYRRLVLVIGILQDKDRNGILAPLVPLADIVVATQPSYNRAMDVRELAGTMGRLHGSVVETATVEEALAAARSHADKDDLIVVTGSLFTVGEARAALRGHAGTGLLAGLKG